MGTASDVSGQASGWSIDSRTLQQGDVFFALRGDTHDGHTYAQSALNQGAAAAVVEVRPNKDPRYIQVSDSLSALQLLASQARQQWGGTVVGVTGSAGKTSTKDIIADLLGSVIPTGRTTGNFNNHIGLPLSILRIPDDARAAVLELGMNHAGEIRELTAIAKPEVAVVTNAGYAHVENFHNGIEGIALAKRELVEGLRPDGIAILNYDDERVRSFASVHRGRAIFYGFAPGADVRAENVELLKDGVRFTVAGRQYQSSLSGKHSILNILAGLSTAQALGIETRQLPDIVRALKPAKMRGEYQEHKGIWIINDCYNSNPEALRSMLQVLRDVPAQRHIAVLGEMLELGQWSEVLHREAGQFAGRCGIAVLAGIRGKARALVEGAIEAGLRKDAAYFFEEPAEAGVRVKEIAREGDAILFKGSRGTHVEIALERFLS